MKTHIPHFTHRFTAFLAAAVTALFVMAHEAKAQYQVTTLGTAVVENFNGMQMPTGTGTTINFNAALGGTSQAQRNDAWVLSSTNRQGNGNGSGTAGGWWAYADANGVNKSLGALGNGSLSTVNATATYVNTTGSTVTSIVLDFTGEQWRRNSATGQNITVQYSINGGSFTSLAGSTYNITNTGTAAQLNGDASGNRQTGLGNTISSISLANGQNIQFRYIWTLGSNSNGFGIDDISVTFNGAAGGDDLYWTANGSTLGGTGTWNNASSNWSPTDTPVAAEAWDSEKKAIFAGDTAGTVTVDTVSAENGIQFSTDGYTLTSGTISLDGTIIADNTITTDTSVGATINSKLSGSTGLTKAGAGTLTLGGANDYTGGTLVSAGRLIGDTTSLQGAITNNAAVTFSQTTNGTYSSVLSGTGSLIKDGSGSVTLSGANSYSGGTLVSAGRLIGDTHSLQGAITNNAAVTFSQTTNGTYSSVLSGSGSLVKDGAGTVTLSGNNSYSGGAEVAAGRLIGTTTSLQGDITNNAAVTFDQSGNGTYAGDLSGSGSVTKTGVGTVTFSSDNSYEGGTTVNGGMLIAASDTALGTESVTITDGSVFAQGGVTVANDFVISGAKGSDTRLQAWDFTGESNLATSAAEVVDSNLNSGGSFNLLTRGAGAASSAGNNSFRTVGFQDDGISTSNTDYFQWSVAASDGNALYLSSLDARFAGTASFRAAPGVSAQFAYSLDGSTFTLIGSPFLLTADTAMSQIDLSGIAELQGLASDTTVTFRYYASGQTTTGGWGFNSPSSGSYGLDVGGWAGIEGGGTIGIDEAGEATFTGNITANNNATFTAAEDGTAVFSGIISGSGAINKTGTGTVTFSGASANTQTGKVTVSAGVLELAKTDGTAAIAGDLQVNSSAKLLLSASNQVANTSKVTLSGGTITRSAGVSETFSDLNLTAASFIDFGAAHGPTDLGTLTFGTYTPSSLLTVNNFFEGNVLVFKSDLSSTIHGALFSIDNGFTSAWDSGTSTFTITAIPEPSACAAAAGLIALMLWPLRKRRALRAVTSGE